MEDRAGQWLAGVEGRVCGKKWGLGDRRAVGLLCHCTHLHVGVPSTSKVTCPNLDSLSL